MKLGGKESKKRYAKFTSKYKVNIFFFKSAKLMQKLTAAEVNPYPNIHGGLTSHFLPTLPGIQESPSLLYPSSSRIDASFSRCCNW